MNISPDNLSILSALVFKIIHPLQGEQYVARVFYHGLTATELVFDTMPSKEEIEKKLEMLIDGDIQYI